MNTISKWALTVPMIGSMLLSAPVLAEEGGAKDKKDKAVKQVELACMKEAITKREDAIVVALDGLHASWKTALGTRKAAFLKAWEVQDNKDRRARIKAATEAFKADRKSGKMVYLRARNGAWDEYRKAAKACNVHRQDMENMALDNA